MTMENERLRMIPKLRHWWQETRASFWFVPAVIVLGAVGLASGLIALDAYVVDVHFDKKWPLLFGAGAGGSRGLLTAVASSMITVAGVVFSITIVALPDDEAAARLSAAYIISRQRTVQQDAGFGIRQIVDIALKALSPGVNDTTTAVNCVDYLGAIIARLVVREFPSPRRLEEGELRVITRGPCFESLLSEAFDQIRQNAAGNVAVLKRQLQSLEIIAGQTSNARRRQALRQQADLITALAERTIPSPHDAASVHAESLRLSRLLDQLSR